MDTIVQKQDGTFSIFEAAMQLHESLDAGHVIGVAMRVLPALVEAQSWAIFLKAEQAERLELVQAVNATVFPLSPFVELDGAAGPLARAALERKTILADSEDRQAEAAASPFMTLSLPLVADRRLIGAVQAMRIPGPATEFTQGEARAAEQVCAFLARALANAIDYANATRQSLVDDLTRLYNVRYLYQTLDNEIRRARRYNSPVSVVFMDLDGFKLVNDIHGHRAGSVTLTEVAQVIARSVREADFIARYGGDEFVMMLPETPASRAVEVAERVRAQIAAHPFSGGIAADIRLTASFGVASFPEHASEAERLIELADAAMYEAKQRDKNNVCLAAT
jgi:diguanylate cyclase (GGDEF)-like protein